MFCVKSDLKFLIIFLVLKESTAKEGKGSESEE
jgi:hypothetical protein